MFKNSALFVFILVLHFFQFANAQDPAIATQTLYTGEQSAASGFSNADVPGIATYNPESVSTTFATAGGNVTDDGGSEISERGLVWSTSENPTVEDHKETSEGGLGSFKIKMTGLEAGTEYYFRAFATNESGTAYGREVYFKTLEEITPPEVSTGDVTEVMAVSASTSGDITGWGGDSVTVRGIVWNTTGTPTIDDFKIESGKGLGEFVATLYPLNSDTRYYVRAFATNGKGTGYGNTRIFKTQVLAPDVTFVVAKDGSGDYSSVQDAFDDIPNNYTGVHTVYVKKGEYYEKLSLSEEKVNVKLIGEDRDSTILTYDDYAGISGGTSQSYSVAINADDFVAENITFQNTVPNDKSFSDQQAVALVTNGDRQAYFNVNILGYQDTYYARGSNGTGRVYFKNSYIEGSVDFIFGRNIVVFDSTEIHINRNGGTLTAAATESESKFGFVFRDNVISADSIGFDGDPITSFHLGRPWQQAPRTVFLNTYYPESLDPEGWLSWNVEPALYGEYNCSGPGCGDFESRPDFATQLSEEEAEKYTLENIFFRESNPNFGRDWMPTSELSVVSINEPSKEIPQSFKLKQNYPNPFNPSTNIAYSLPKLAHVKITVYNMLGKQVGILVNQPKKAGDHIIKFNASSLASGVYLYRLEAGGASETNKMILIK
ncbi:pectinesterase family protein [Gracilimonas sp.]|uniref:pectinesterase family protein n=1 Tax=Gracilimonas sp. TaxID=1974203 RepID=UPI0032EE1112